MLLLVTLLTSALTLVDSVMIRSDRVTNWGNWGPLDQCPPGSFVKAINVKVEPSQGGKDDTAMNAVHLSCVALEQQVTTDSFPVTKVLASAEGPWGDFKGMEICYRGVAVGFQLRSEDGQGRRDDTAANDMVLICANSDGEQKTMAKGQGWGSWRSDKRCPPRTAVCGLQTQVEPHQGKRDDTALNNVDLMCCELPNPAESCSATDEWIEILRRDNSQGTTPIKYTVREKVGVKKELSITQSSSVIEEIAKSVGYSMSLDILKTLKTNFDTKLSTSTKTQHSWSQTDADTFSFEKEETTEISIPAKCDTTLSQIVGKCGSYLVNANAIKRVDTCYDSNNVALKTTSFTTLDK